VSAIASGGRGVRQSAIGRVIEEAALTTIIIRAGDSDRADAAALAQAFRQMHQAAVTVNEVLRRNDRLNEAVPADWPLPMGATEFAAACHAMVAYYEELAA
jgi:hypothetical protein